MKYTDIIRMALVFVQIGLFCLICWLVFSCNPEKKLQRKRNKTEFFVATDPVLKAKIYKDAYDEKPCVTDTTIFHDTTITTRTLTNIISKTDTIKKNDSIYIFHTDTAYFDKIIYREKQGFTVDKRMINIMNDSINDLHRVLSSKEATIKAKQDRIDELKSTNKKLWIWLIVIIVAALTTTIIKIYLSLNPSPKNILNKL